MINLKTVVINETVAKLGQQTSHALIAEDARIRRLEEQTQKKESDNQETLASLRAKVQALTEKLVKAREEIKQVKSAQYTMLQRHEEQAQKTEANALKLNRDLAETKHSLQDTRQALYHLDGVTRSTFIYSYKQDYDQLHRTNLVTGEQSIHRVLSYRFKTGCCWSEVPGGSLLITGGGWPAVREVVRIDVGTFEVFPQPLMLTPRAQQAAVYHTQHLYVLGGWSDSRFLSECERYACAEKRWEALPPLPRACSYASGVVVDRNLYALGGYDGSYLDLVQKLSLESLTWELMQLRLPFAGRGIPCFKLRDAEVYLVVNKTLCSFTDLEVLPLMTLTEDFGSWYGASYYHRGTLYCSSDWGAVNSHQIGSLSN
jgi:hypothetical protein